MNLALLVPLAFAVAIVLVLARSIVIVPQGQACLVERLGRYDRTLSPGIAILFPFVDAVRARVPLAERTLELPAAPAASVDGRAMTTSGTVLYRIVDPRRAIYGVADYEQAISAVVARMLAQVVAEGEVVQAPGVAAAALDRARALVEPWGIALAALDAHVIPIDDAAAVARRLDSRVQPRAARLARAAGALAPGATGLVEDGGRLRTARNVSDDTIARGAPCHVQGEDGEVLLIVSATD